MFVKVNDIFQCKLQMENGTEFLIPMREDGYVYATGLCKAAGKKLQQWKDSANVKNIVKELSKTRSNLIEVHKAGNKYNQGTWLHPDLGIILAQWCSPSFAIQVSKWVRELVIYDEVKLGSEKSELEITAKYNDIITQLVKKDEELNKKEKELEDTIAKLQAAEQVAIASASEARYVSGKYNYIVSKHQAYLKRKEKYKLREGLCTYLINMIGPGEDYTVSKIKVGFTGNITNRVSDFRTPCPLLQVHMVLYTEHAGLLEQMMKTQYRENLEPNNSEFISDVPVEVLMEVLENHAKTLNLSYELESEEELEKFNRHYVKAEDIEEVITVPEGTRRCGGQYHEDENSRYLPYSEYFKNGSNRDGYARLCKECYLIGQYGDKRKRKKVVAIPKYDVVTHKWCNRCESVKELTRFGRCKDTKDGLSSNCKECKADQKKKNKLKATETTEIETANKTN